MLFRYINDVSKEHGLDLSTKESRDALKAIKDAATGLQPTDFDSSSWMANLTGEVRGILCVVIKRDILYMRSVTTGAIMRYTVCQRRKET